MIIIVSCIVCLLMAFCLGCELRRDLMMLQQNSYRRERYMKWLRVSGDTTSISRLIALVILFISLCSLHLEIIGLLLTAVFAICRSWSLMRARYKKPLVMTARATRIFVTDIVVAAIIVAVAVACALKFGLLASSVAVLTLLTLYCLSHVVTLLSNFILQPVEKSINRKYYNDAKKRLESMPDLKIIGITGSYGKTSTKHYLQRILSEQFDTLMTPGSFNTTLGVIRTVREYLKPYNEVFIVEMGAKQKGDIKEICDLVHPTIGIITAVGPQHLESFKTIENVRDTKFELADALPADGLAVLNDDFEMVANRDVTTTHVKRYSVKNTTNASFTAEDIIYSPSGTRFAVRGPEGFEMIVETKLVGECNIANLLAAIVVALELGINTEKIRYAVSQIEQVEHRLSIKRTPGGVTILDDAFNSNPSGSAIALDVLAMMKGGRRIVVTPGMIELGESQYNLNYQFGQHIAECADLAIVVGHYNREAIVKGICDGGMDESKIHTFNSFAEAQTFLNCNLKSGDFVLYENDLPDTFK